jgi:hypothetical protein
MEAAKKRVEEALPQQKGPIVRSIEERRILGKRSFMPKETEIVPEQINEQPVVYKKRGLPNGIK